MNHMGHGGYVLLASCGDDHTGGGIFAFDGRSVERVDALSSGGMFATRDRLFRMLRSSADDSMGELLTYDHRGITDYHRLDNVLDPHDIAWDGRELVVVSTATNCIFWLSPSGKITREWKAPGEGDAWHLNSLLIKDGRLYVSAFGRFERHRAWNLHKGNCAGVVFDLQTGRDVLTGLSCPHHPRFLDGAWVVCNSANQEIVRMDARTGAVRQRLQLQQWTRGFAATDDCLFIGESAKRHAINQWTTAAIVVICRKSWQILERLPLPCLELYDLVLVPSALCQGVYRGFRTNPQRVSEQDQYALFRQAGVQPLRLWATGEPLPHESRRARITASLPDRLEADALIDLACIVENLGNAIFVSAAPNPVLISYQWIDPGTGQILSEFEGMRTRLPEALPPARSLKCNIHVRAPSREGAYVLRLTLVQEFVAWFDDMNPKDACARLVQVVQPRASALPQRWKTTLKAA
jgi:hypothetical protein